MLVKKFGYSKKKITELSIILTFLKGNRETDFYLTENNERVYINDLNTIKKFFKNCVDIYLHYDKGNVDGVLVTWRGIGGTVKRLYLKISAVNSDAGKDLVTALLWNCNYNLHAKLRKDSPFLYTLKSKGFNWFHGRGKQILLKRDKFTIKKNIEDKTNER